MKQTIQTYRSAADLPPVPKDVAKNRELEISAVMYILLIFSRNTVLPPNPSSSLKRVHTNQKIQDQNPREAY
jgi:hypothetical protein